MIPEVEPLVAEIEQEADITRRVLERVPADQLSWKPHEKSMSLGQLALHVATIPGNVTSMISGDGFDVSTVDFIPETLNSTADLQPRFEESLEKARENLAAFDSQRAEGMWRLTRGDKEIMAVPRIALVRSLAMNHLYHHRGALCVYLRLLGVPVPVTYGRSADENPFDAV